MIKLIVSDLDGTLLTNQKTISQTNLDTIQLAKESGIEFMIATGREYNSVKALIDQYHLPCETILMNGAMHRDIEGNITRLESLDESLARRVIAILEGHKVAMTVCFETRTYGLSNERDFQESLVRRFRNIQPPIKETVIEELLGQGYWTKMIRLDTVEELFAIQEPILKIEAFDFHQGTFLLVKEDLANIGVSLVPYGQHSMEITAPLAQKGIMLEEVMRRKQLKKEEIMVLGDGYNDISMFTRFPHSVAMFNANDDIKEHASFVTTTNGEDGVSYAIHSIALAK